MNTAQAHATPTVLLVGWPGHGRDALAELVRSQADWFSLSCADTGLLALKAAREQRLRAVIIGSGLPDLEVIELVRQLKQHFASLQCMVLAERADVQREALLAGADVVMPPGAAWGQLLPVIHKLIEG